MESNKKLPVHIINTVTQLSQQGRVKSREKKHLNSSFYGKMDIRNNHTCQGRGV